MARHLEISLCRRENLESERSDSMNPELVANHLPRVGAVTDK